jgi:hypothetical protein
MQRRSGFNLLTALQHREMTGAVISAAQVMPQLIRSARYYLDEYAKCKRVDVAKDILLELKLLALLDVECVIDFYVDELWKNTQLDAAEISEIRQLLARDILQIYNSKQHPKLGLYLCRAVNYLPCDLNLDLLDIRSEFAILERAAAGKSSYATKAAYLLFLIYVQEKNENPNNLCFNQIFLNYCRILPLSDEVNVIQRMRLQGREAIAELGSDLKISALELLYTC